MTMAGSDSGKPRGGSVMTARALWNCCSMSAGPAMTARPHAGERDASPPHAAAKTVRARSRNFMRSNLIRPRGGDGDRTHGREGLGDEIVHIVEGVGDEQSQLDLAPRPAGAEVEDAQRDAPRVDEALELDLCRPAPVAEVGAEGPRAAAAARRVVRGRREQVGRPKCEEWTGVEVLVRQRGGVGVRDWCVG